MLGQYKRGAMILGVAVIGLALPVSLPTAGASDGPAAVAKKKCKKGQKRVKGKCKSTAPKLGSWKVEAPVTDFKVTPSGVEMAASVQGLSCGYRTGLALLISDRAPMQVKGGKFSMSGGFQDDQGGLTQKVDGKFTSATAAEGTFQVIEVYNGQTCDTGVRKFKVKK